jgi:hypothetical protein
MKGSGMRNMASPYTSYLSCFFSPLQAAYEQVNRRYTYGITFVYFKDGELFNNKE